MSIISEYSDVEEYLHDLYVNYEETVFDIWDNCVVLSVLSVVPTLCNIIILNFCFAIISTQSWVPKASLHLITGVIGIYLIINIESYFGRVLFLVCWATSLILLQISYRLRKYFNSSNFLKITFIILLVLCEYCLVEPQTWLQIRGIVMILVMKVISLADDTEKLNSSPSLIQYFGYTFCGANIMFGPWVSFADYLNLCEKTPKKNFVWILVIIQVVFTSLIFLSLSNCWSTYFIGDDANKWLVAYREAFSFRTSHYFISYLAEAGMIASGFTNSTRGYFSQFRYTVTEPLEIEFPSSLSVVVKNWNQPMHDFLKKYVYRSWLKYGNLYAILATFLISSFFHGLEIKVSVVLISIGLFSYLQVVPRDRIAEIFDCCVRVRPCKDCKHKYKRNSIIIRLMLLFYSFATIFHLSYLGVLMDSSTDEVGIYEKWQNLYFVSHIVMCFNLLVII